MPQLTVLSGVGCPPRRRSSKHRRRLGSSSKRRNLNLGFFRCTTKRSNVDSSSHHHLSPSMINRHHRINSIMKRFKVKKLKFKATTKKRRTKKKKIISHVSSIGNLYGGLIMKRRKAKRSIGRTLAKRFGVSRGKCKKAGKRRVCKTRRGKGYIRKDKISRLHRSTGRFSVNNIGGFGLANVGAFRADSCAHRVSRAGYGGWRKPRRKSRSKRRSSVGFLGLGNIGISMPKVSSVTSMLPALNVASLKKYGAVVSGMTTPLLLQRFLPKSLTFGWKGLLTYLGLGGVTIMVSKKVPFMKSNADEIAVGVGAGFIFKVFQDIIFKRSLFPAQNIKGIAYLDGVDACTNCSNVGDCSDVGRCLGYSDDEVGSISDSDDISDSDKISDYEDVGDSDIDGIDDDGDDEVGAYASYDYDSRGADDDDD